MNKWCILCGSLFTTDIIDLEWCDNCIEKDKNIQNNAPDLKNKCTCGCSSIGLKKHSDWCDIKFEE